MIEAAIPITVERDWLDYFIAGGTLLAAMGSAVAAISAMRAAAASSKLAAIEATRMSVRARAETNVNDAGTLRVRLHNFGEPLVRVTRAGFLHPLLGPGLALTSRPPAAARMRVSGHETSEWETSLRDLAIAFSREPAIIAAERRGELVEWRVTPAMELADGTTVLAEPAVDLPRVQH